MQEGVWLGTIERTEEYLIGTDKGVVKCRTIWRKATEEERWDRSAVESMKGTPWEPEPGRDTIEVGIRLRRWTEVETSQGPRIPEGVPQVRRPYRYRVSKELVKEHEKTYLVACGDGGDVKLKIMEFNEKSSK